MVQFFFAVSGAGNTTSLVMVLTELTGLYAISSVLLIRKQLPLKYRSVKTPASILIVFTYSEKLHKHSMSLHESVERDAQLQASMLHPSSNDSSS